MRCTASRATPTTFSTTSIRALDAVTRAARLQQLSDQFFSPVEHPGNPVLAAVRHTARRYHIADELFDDFLASMRMDLTVTDYPDRDAINLYMKGSAEAIGLQVLPILGTMSARDEAAPHAAALGRAFQLTNFLRDIDEDLMRGRVYLPADELAAHDVDRDVSDVVPPQPSDRSAGAQRVGRAA